MKTKIFQEETKQNAILLLWTPVAVEHQTVNAES